MRKDDHGYRVAAAARLGDARILERSVAELREAFPDFEPEAFAASLPYEHEKDRQAVRDALALAQLESSA